MNGGTSSHINLAHGTLTRVGYIDVVVAPEVVGLSSAEVANVSWAAPQWDPLHEVWSALIGPPWPSPVFGRWENGVVVAGE